MYQLKTFICKGATPHETWEKLTFELREVSFIDDIHFSGLNFNLKSTSDGLFLATAAICFKPLKENPDEATGMYFVSTYERESFTEYDSINALLQDWEDIIQDSQLIKYIKYDTISYKTDGKEMYFSYGILLFEKQKQNSTEIDSEEVLSILEGNRFRLWGILKYGQSSGFKMSNELYPPNYKIEYP